MDGVGKSAAEGGRKVEEQAPATPAAASYAAPGAVITWETNGSGKGHEKSSFRSGPVYTLEAGVKQTLLMAVGVGLQELFKTVSGQHVPLKPTSFHPSTGIRPALSMEHAHDLRERAHLAAAAALPGAVRTAAASFARATPAASGASDSDGKTGDGGGEASAAASDTALALPPAEAGDDVFLGALQVLGRDYRAGCVICLSDAMMGTTCTCGHTEIVVFRPCGHSVCVEPCFRQLCQSKGIAPQRKTITLPNGQVFYVGSQMDVKTVSGFDCPICRSNVASCFRAEEVHASKALINALGVDQMVKDIIASLLPADAMAAHEAVAAEVRALAAKSSDTASGAGEPAPRSEEE